MSEAVIVATAQVAGDAVTVDARGLLCPLPIIALAKAAATRGPGTVLTVLCTDPAARIDVPAWARMTGNAWLGEHDLGEHDLGEQSPGEKSKEADGGAFALTVRLC